MESMKRFAKYIIFLILFWILSDILIQVGIDSTYKTIQQKGTTPEGVEIIQLQATAVNGRAKIKIKDKELSGKFLKIDLYSSTGVKLGTQYMEIGNVKSSEGKELETYFKISEVKSYELTIVEEKGESTEGFMDTALSAMTVVGFVIKLLFI